MNLDERARRATSALFDHADDADRDEIFARVTRRARRRRFPAVAVAAAAAAVIAAAVVVAPRLTDGGVSIEQPDDVAGTTEAPSSPGVPAGTTVGTWQRIPDPDGALGGPGEQAITGLAAGNGAAVAVGDDRGQAAVWRAVDGRAERVGADLCGEASCAIGDVASFAEAFVAVGQVDGLPKAWLSEDGAAWERVDLPLAGAPGASTLHQVVAGGDGAVVALGAVERDGETHPVAYRRDPATGEWERAEFGPAYPIETPVTFDALTWFAGRYVAIAHAGDGFDFAHSDDGLVWQISRPTPGVFEPYPTFPNALVVDGDQLLALGTSYVADGPEAAAWTSGDGVSWRRAATEESGGLEGAIFSGGAFVAGRLVSVGSETPAGLDSGRPAAWQRGNDGTWERLDGGDAFDVRGALTMAVAVDGHSLLVAGRTSATDPDAGLWLYTVERGGAPPGGEEGGCSAGGVSVELLDAAGLPPVVADMRTALFQNAVACDYPALEQLARRGGQPFTFSFGAGEGDSPAAHWRDAEGRGEQPLRYLAELLGLRHGRVTTADGGVVFVWPRAAASDRPSDEEYRELVDAGLYTQSDIDSFRRFGGYIGYHVGITASGEWLFFVAGD